MPIEKRILLDNVQINYTVSLSKKARNLRIEISPQKGVVLIVPKGIHFDDAESFLNQKKDWILKHYGQISQKKQGFFFLGNELNVKRNFDPKSKKHQIEFKNNELIVVSPINSQMKIEELFERWLKLKASQFIPVEVENLASKYGFEFNRITIRGQKTRWGSCSRRKNLSFNYNLMKLPKRLIEYVIIHELCHLKELNHSERFWNLVKEILPDYKLLRRELKIMG